MASKHALTKYLPTFDRAQSFLRIVEGSNHQVYRQMHGEVMSQTGTPQSTVDWKQPEVWMPLRLDGACRSLAYRIWRESEGIVNPRYTDGIWSLCTMHGLVNCRNEKIILTDTGKNFLENDFTTLSQIDFFEGTLQILTSVSELGPGQRRDFLENHRHFCLTHTTWKAESLVYETLGLRLKNLLQRQLIAKFGRKYQITAKGAEYLRRGSE